MDEVDIDNVEDLNELEARLYAQIHHEATDETTAPKDLPPQGSDETLKNPTNTNDGRGGSDNEKTYETSSNTNRVLSKRYWASGEHAVKQIPQNTTHRFIRNPFKPPDHQSQTKQVDETTSTNAASAVSPCVPASRNFDNIESNKDFLPNKNDENTDTAKNNSNRKSADESLATNTSNDANDSSATAKNIQAENIQALTNKSKKNKNSSSKTNQNAPQKQNAAQAQEKSNLKLNPVADWMKRNKNQMNKKSNSTQNPNSNNKTSSNNSSAGISKQPQQGPFAKQHQKLQKAKRLEDKKQKSKKAKNTAAALTKKIKPTEIIDLDSDNESDCSDVVVIPLPPPPTFTVDDSDEDKEDLNDSIDSIEEPIILQHEENALDSTDVQMSSTSSSFIKPQTHINQQSLSKTATNVAGEKNLDNSSRCTSPCSIQSSDDFIGQTDRSRLLTGASGMADDEDLLVLTTDISSLLEAPQTSTKHNEQVEEDLDSSLEHTDAANESSEFATPRTSKAREQEKDYRVDQSQFKALDVYESESDITDSVYSKGTTSKSTVIRQIDTSSDDDDVQDISVCSQRTKRLRKRRASSSNKDNDDNDDDEPEEDDDNDLLRTAIPFIARGPAVERSKLRKRSRTLSTCSPITQVRKSTKANKSTLSSPAHMSDGEFIATLNNLAQGQDGEEKGEDEDNDDVEEGDESDTENAPSARDIAEKILAQHVENANIEALDDDSDMAIPDDVYKELDKVFETIDKMEEVEKQRNSQTSPDEAVSISDSSDSNQAKQIVYKSLPNEENHIVTFIEDTTSKNKTPEKRHAENGSPIYNVIYSRGQRSAGGIGWNDEMRKFYNESWNGEHFVLKRVLQRMNPDKHLWKIYSEDRFNIKSNRRHNNLKCTNCCEFGHMRSKCKRPKKPMICYMCGDSGHQEPRCPNTICLRCGNKTQVFTKSCNACSYQNRLICPICKIRGHSLDFCPDKWRRYHSTTEPNDYPNSTVDYNPRKHCCICGGRGHLSDNCRSAVRFMEYPVIVSAVKSHQKSYGDLPVKSQHGGIGYNLMYEPCKEFRFDLVDRTTNNKYYGRFLNAVGLDFMLRRKRRLNSITTDTTAKKTKRLAEKYIANPYSRVGCANQKDTESSENAPNQVQEISESCGVDEQELPTQEKEIISVEDNSNDDDDVELVGSTVTDNVTENIQLNTIKESPARMRPLQSFKSPTTVTSSLATPTKSNSEPALILDSDSNYSFSEHFDVPSTSAAAAAASALKTNLNVSQNEEESFISINEDTNNYLEQASNVAPNKETNDSSNETLNVSPNEETNISASELTNVTANEESNISTNEILNTSSRPKPREMEALPDFIPLIDSTEDLEDEEVNERSLIGISRQFIAAESDDDDDVDDEHVKNSRRRTSSPLPEIPCDAKIYLTHFHSKYLLSPEGNSFLIKTSRAFKLKARLDFTSIGHVLVIFGLPSNQDKFQRELLLKYRELIDKSNQKQPIKTINVPKRADVLIRFLRDNINQLLNNLGNVNQLLQRLRNLERQQSKSGFKLAEKVRRSLNMILVGQAGLQDGSMHLDRLLLSLKTLINDYAAEDVAPQQLRTEITDHWKVIFTPYRHENYQQLVETYNRLISKNRMPTLAIDPILLGQKVLDTTLTAEQREKLEQPKMLKDSVEHDKQVVRNPLNPKNAKRKPTERANNSPPPPAPSSKLKSSSRATSPSIAPPAPSMRLDLSNSSTPNKSKTSGTTLATTPGSNNASKRQSRGNSPSKADSSSSTPNKLKSLNKSKATSTASATASANKKPSRPNSPSKASSTKRSDPSNTSTPNKSKQSQNTTSTAGSPAIAGGGKKKSRPNSPSNTTTKSKTSNSASPSVTVAAKKQKTMPPPPFANPENRSTVSTTIQQVSDKWKSTCDSLLTEISAETSKNKPNDVRDSKKPSTFWSRESMRYLDECVQLASSRSEVIEKLQRVQNKSKNGQLSYNDYLAVIKLHTALSGK